MESDKTIVYFVLFRVLLVDSSLLAQLGGILRRGNDEKLIY